MFPFLLGKQTLWKLYVLSVWFWYWKSENRFRMKKLEPPYTGFPKKYFVPGSRLTRPTGMKSSLRSNVSQMPKWLERKIEAAVNAVSTFLVLKASLVAVISALLMLVLPPLFWRQKYHIALMFWHRIPVFLVMPLRLVAKVHIPLSLALTSLVSV